MPIIESLAPAPAAVKSPEPTPTRIVVTRSPQQKTTTETPVAESTPTAESVTLPEAASANARKEQAYRQREAALKAKEVEQADKLKLADLYSQLKAKLDAKDFSAVEELGVNYDGYTEYLLAKQEADPVAEKYKQLETEIKSIKTSQEEKAASEYEATVAEYDKEIKSVVSSNPEFSSIKELGQEQAVLQLILDSWEEDGTELSVEEAAKDVESFLVEEANKFAALSKLKSKPLPKPSLKTLTQQVTIGAERAPGKPLSQLPESERYAEARRRALAKRQG